MLQPFWFRALGYGIPFAVVFGVYSYVQPHTRAAGVVVAMLVAGMGFGLAMAYQGRTMHAAMREAVAGLDDARRARAIAAVTGGDVPADEAVRNAALRLGVAYLGGKSETQLNRAERQTWLLLALLMAGMAALVATSTNTAQTAFPVALAVLCLVALPRAVVRTRRLRRTLAPLSAGSATR